MTGINTNHSGRFFGRTGSVCALCAVLALPAIGVKAQTGDKDVKVTDYGSVDISVQDTDLAVVLQMLSIESKKNIITSKSVSATVTANLYDVTFEEALKAILDVNGYTYYEEGNFIYVVTKEELVAMQRAARRAESRVFELDHLAAADAMEFLLPLLSESGRASARGDVKAGMKPGVGDAGKDDYAYAPRVVVNDFPEHLDAVAQLLAELDVPPQQVLVEATILQTALDEANAFGVDFSILGSLNFSDLVNPLGGPLQAVTSLLTGGNPGGVQPADNRAVAVGTSVGNTAGPGGLKVGVIADDIAVFLRILDEVTDSQVLARPKVMALNRQRAEVLVGARVGYLSTTSTETTTTQSVSFLDTGIQLVFRPFISKDGMIRMELKPSVSEASLRAVTDANGLIVTIPDELTNELTTNVRVRDGQTLVLGGLFKDSTRVSRRQVPLLGDIPIVGAAFRGQDDSVERSEIIFLITPSIVRDEVLWAKGQELLNSVDAIRVGARAGLLPFSRDKVTSRYNQSAQEAFNRGDNDRALYYINNSLRLAPSQPEMVKLRERVTGKAAVAHEHSVMERALRREIGPVGGAANPKPIVQADYALPGGAPDWDPSQSASSDPYSANGTTDPNAGGVAGSQVNGSTQFNGTDPTQPGASTSSGPVPTDANGKPLKWDALPPAVATATTSTSHGPQGAVQPGFSTSAATSSPNSTSPEFNNSSNGANSAPAFRNPTGVDFNGFNNAQPTPVTDPTNASSATTSAITSTPAPGTPPSAAATQGRSTRASDSLAAAPGTPTGNNRTAAASSSTSTKSQQTGSAKTPDFTSPSSVAGATSPSDSTSRQTVDASGKSGVKFIEYPPYPWQGGTGTATNPPTTTTAQKLAGEIRRPVAGGAVKELTPAQRELYRQFLHDYFTSLGMPHIAAAYGPDRFQKSGGQFPFTTFDDVTGVAGANKPQDPRP